MDAVKYLKEKTRMFNSLGRTRGTCNGVYCGHCPFEKSTNGKGVYCSDFIANYPEEAVAIVEKWSAKHPQKTILQDFLEKYPNALLRANGTGVPESCCKNLGFGQLGECYKTTCKDCWNRPLEG